MNIFKYLKGGNKSMPRNLVSESEQKKQESLEAIKNEVEGKDSIPKQVEVITENQLILIRLNELLQKVIYGFEKCGVDFKDLK